MLSSSPLVLALVLLVGCSSLSRTHADYQLRLVQVVTRHGDRTPTKPLSVDPIEWNCDTAFVEAMYHPQTGLPRRFLQVDYLEQGDVLRGNCSAGQLTSLGYEQQASLGVTLWNRYVKQLGFLPADAYDPTRMAIRTTSIPRTQASAEGLLSGLYPISSIRSSNPSASIVTVETLDGSHEYIHINPSFCPRVGELYVSMFVADTPERNQILNILAPHEKDWIEIFHSADPFVGIENFDALRCRKAHGLPFPPGLTNELYNVLAKAFDLFGVLLFNSTYFSLAPFYEEILTNMQDVMTGNSSLLWKLYSGHDTTVGPLLSALGAFDGHWPPYASHVVLELLEDTQGEFYVQVFYQDQPLTLSGCGGSSICHIEEFFHLMQSAIPANLKEACKLKNPLLLRTAVERSLLADTR